MSVRDFPEVGRRVVVENPTNDSAMYGVVDSYLSTQWVLAVGSTGSEFVIHKSWKWRYDT